MNYNDMAARFGMGPMGSPLTGFDARTMMSGYTMRTGVTGRYTMRTGASGWTTAAIYEREIPRAAIVRLKDIKRKQGEIAEEFDEREIYGFNKRKWEAKMYNKYHIDASEGTKHYLGSWIKTVFNRRKRFFRFTVRNKATDFQISALISQIEGKCPPFDYVTVQVHRKKYENLAVTTLDSLKSFITTELISRPDVTINIIW